MAQRFARILAGITFVAAGGGTALLVRLGIYSTVFLAGAISAGAGVYLLATRQRKATEVTQDAAPLSDVMRKRILRIATVLFFLFTAGSLLTLRSELYGKPAAYFALVAASAGMVALRIALLESTKEVRSTLAMIILVALNFFGSDQLVFPLGIGGGDGSTHLHFLVDPIVRSGFIPPTDPCGLFYGTFPTHHIFVAMGSILMSVDPTRVYYGFGTFAMTLLVPVEFLIGRSVFGTRVGLFAALLLSGSSYFIYWASHAAPTSYGLSLIGLILFALVTMLERPNSRLILVAGLFALALVLVHPYSTVIFGILLVGLVVGQVLARRAVPRPWPWGTRIVSVSFLYTLLIYWSNFSCLMTKSFQLTAQYYQLLTSEAQFPSGGIYNRLPLSLLFVNTAGDSILQFLVIIGFFLVLAYGVTPKMMMIVGPTLILFLVSIVGLVFPLTWLNPNRIYAFLEAIGFAPLAAFAVRAFIGYERRPPRGRLLFRVGLVGVVVAVFMFASPASTIAGFETSVFVGGQPFVKLYETPPEVASATWLCGYVAGPVTVNVSRSMFAEDRFDVRECVLLHGGSNGYLPIRPDRVVDPLALRPGALIWFSRYDKSPGFFRQLVGPNVFGSGLVERLSPSGDTTLGIDNRLYDNGAVQVYLVPG
jgi:Dolichyl-phosphate-mannose-protein mannosyltransferase